MIDLAQSLRSLKFYLRNRDDLDALCETGPEAPEDVQQADWDKMWSVVELADAQATRLIQRALRSGADELTAGSIRVEAATRSATVARRWEGWFAIKLPRMRSNFAYVGVNLGLTSSLGTGLHLFFGHAEQRSLRGPALSEALRTRGRSVVVADGRGVMRGWRRGTVVLGCASVDPRVSADDLVSFAQKTVLDALVANWELVAAS